jgi:membrane protease YdiL (CAAX protease family)
MDKQFEKKEYTPLTGILFLLFYLIFTILLSVPASFVQGEYGIFLSYCVGPIVTIVMFVIFIKVFDSTNFAKDFTLFNKEPKKFALNTAIAVPFAVGAFAQCLLLYVLWLWLMHAMGSSPSVAMPNMDNGLKLFLSVITLCLLPAIAEELMFRGLLFAAFKKFGFLKASLLVSVIFAASHFNLAQIVYQIVFSFYLCYAVHKTSNLVFGMLAHFVSNCIAIGLPLTIEWYNGLETVSRANAVSLIIVSLIGTIIIALCFAAYAKINGGKELELLQKIFKRKEADNKED